MEKKNSTFGDLPPHLLDLSGITPLYIGGQVTHPNIIKDIFLFFKPFLDVPIKTDLHQTKSVYSYLGFIIITNLYSAYCIKSTYINDLCIGAKQ